MRHRRFIGTILVFLAFANVMMAGNEKTRVYVYGFAASFNDSTIYFTDIQEVDTAWVDTRTKFLLGRDGYSSQLKQYLQGLGVAQPTCITSFGFNRKKIEKKYLAFKKKYTKDTGYDVKYIAPTDFQYEGVEPYEISMAQEAKKTKVAKPSKKERKRIKKGGGGSQPEVSLPQQ